MTQLTYLFNSITPQESTGAFSLIQFSCAFKLWRLRRSNSKTASQIKDTLNNVWQHLSIYVINTYIIFLLSYRRALAVGYLTRKRSSNTAEIMSVFFRPYGDLITNVVVWTCWNHVPLLLRKLVWASRISCTYVVNRYIIFLLSVILELRGLIILRKRSSNIAENIGIHRLICWTWSTPPSKSTTFPRRSTKFHFKARQATRISYTLLWHSSIDNEYKCQILLLIYPYTSQALPSH